MAQYKFIKNFANKRAGESYSLIPSVASVLLSKGVIAENDTKIEAPAKEKTQEKKKTGRPKK